MDLPAMDDNLSLPNVVTSVNYYDDPGDGSKPEPVYVGQYDG